MQPLHPQLRLWLELFEILFDLAEKEIAATRHRLARLNRIPRRRGAYCTLRPSDATPFWNSFSALLRQELKLHGSKIRLARYLGIPKQRITDFVTGRRRMPDAELTLRMIHWLIQRRAFQRDHAI